MSFPTTSNDGRVDLAVMQLATLSNPVYAEYDYTNPAIANQYNQAILTLFNVYNQGVTYSSPTATNPNPIPANRLTQQDADNVAQALAALVNLAQNGEVLNNTPTSLKKYFLTQSMVTNLDILLRSFEAVGATNPTQGITLEQLNAWKDLSIESPVIQGTMTTALQQITANTSIQALIELDYVKTGSDLINQKLTDLDRALTLTQGILNTLGGVQAIHNDVTAYSRGSIPFNYPGPYGSADEFRATYTTAASNYFGRPINAVIPSTLLIYSTMLVNYGGAFSAVPETNYSAPIGITQAGLSVFNNLLILRQSILNEIHLVSAQSSASDLTNPESLINKIKKVASDLSTLFAVTNPSNPTGPLVPASAGLTGLQKASALMNWILDNYNNSAGAGASNAGLIQQNITLAITSAQSLNDTQKENVRNYLFIFQEYYQSASAILQAINQILQKMAQGISQ